MVLLGCLVLPMSAQNASTQGKEFWVSFLGNGYRDNDNGGTIIPYIINQVLISGKRDCTGTITNPNTGWSQSFFVRANSITTIDHLEDQSYVETSDNERIVQQGLRIVTTDTVSVFCTNIAHVSFDASYVLPLHALADDYMVQTYDQSTYIGWNTEYEQFLTSAFLIVATEDNTTVDITPTVSSFTGFHPADERFNITLNAGEVYQYRSTYNSNQRDLSGTRITARDCKRIAVFNGNTLTAVPDSRTSRDMIFEQVMPLRSWGKCFVVTSSFGRNEDYVKVTSSADNNTIRKNGELLTILNAGESYTFMLTGNDASCFIESRYPSAVFLFNTSYESSMDHYGDPSMVWIAPVEQRIDEITFTTFHDADVADIDNHYVNIIVNTEDISSVYLDDQLISPLLFQRVNGNNDYSYTRKEITHDVHHLSCAHGFNAHVYGFGYAKGYAYLVGSKAANLSSSLVINDVSVQPQETFPYCAEEPITFTAEVNLQNYHLLWDFGDGTTSSDNPVTHTYHDRRVFNASLSITTDEGGCTGSASDTTYFYIDATQQYVTESDEMCEGTLYSGYGFNNVRINNDTILTRLIDNPLHNECQDSLLVYITAHPTYHIPINDSRCWHGEPGVYDDHGFSFVYDHPDIYERELDLQTHPYGCDSILYLRLTISNQITYEFDTVTCSTFVWDGIEYNQTQDIENTYDLNGCDSIVTCHLTIGGTISGDTLSRTACNSYTWYGTEYSEAGIYPHTIASQSGCDTIKHLHLTLSHTPTPKINCATSGALVYGSTLDTVAVVTNTEFFSFQYDFYVEDTLGHFNDWDSCRWSISRPTWAIEDIPNPNENEPNRRYCKVYVAERDDNIVELSCTVYHLCEQSIDSVTTTFYLKSSFFDIDEQSTAQPGLSIIPNPNNGQMTLSFDHWDGCVEVRVYDMLGTLIDRLETESPTEAYSLNAKAPGVYCFVVTGRNGTLAKKVVVTH